MFLVGRKRDCLISLYMGRSGQARSYTIDSFALCALLGGVISLHLQQRDRALDHIVVLIDAEYLMGPIKERATITLSTGLHHQKMAAIINLPI